MPTGGRRPTRTWAKGYFRVGGFSRQKGMREERALVQHLKDLGYDDALRVPLSGASKGFKFDVLAYKEGREISFELKTRKDGYNWLYKFLEGADTLRFSYEGSCVSIAKTPQEAEAVGTDNPFFMASESSRIHSRILKLKNLKKDADFLVVKSNNKSRLFLKYWT